MDFTNPTEPREVAWHSVKPIAGQPETMPGSNNWTTYWHNGYFYGHGVRGLEILEVLYGPLSHALNFPDGAFNPQTQLDMFDESMGCTEFGTANALRAEGHGGTDVICGFGGGDEITDWGGADTIGREGHDGTQAAPGADVAEGSVGNDDLFGQGGGDELSGGDGHDGHFGGPGTDVCKGGEGSNFYTSCENKN